jgi:hypothetical protein
MWGKIQKLFDRVERRITLVVTLGGSGVMGVITGWLSTGVDWINQFGWFGWWLAFMVGALLTAYPVRSGDHNL